MLRNFRYSNVNFKQEANGGRVVIAGEITNTSAQNYHAVVFKIFLFLKKMPICTTSITINGFNSGQVRIFEHLVEELEYNKVMNNIVGHEIIAESAY